MSKEIQFLIYSLPDEEGKVQVVIKDETLWCTQKAMAQLFGGTTTCHYQTLRQHIQRR